MSFLCLLLGLFNSGVVMILLAKKESSFFDVDFSEGLKVQVDKCKEKYFRNWMKPFLEIWPEFTPPAEEQAACPRPVSRTVQSSDEAGSDSANHNEELKAPASQTTAKYRNDNISDEAPIFEGQVPECFESATNQDHVQADSLSDRNLSGSADAGGSGEEEKAPLFTLSQPRPASPIPKKAVGAFMWDDSQNIIPGGRATRANRGRRNNDPVFPMVEPVSSLLDGRKRKRKRP